MLSSRHDMVTALMYLYHLWLFAQDLNKSKPINILAWM